MRRPRTRLRGRVAILSPHLDDAVYSLGAAVSESVESGSDVSVITVFAGDPDSTRPASPWDRRFGFQSSGEAARVRREEDGRACALLGASPVWLPFEDEYGCPTDDGELRSSIEHAVSRADTILVPGFPLDHIDHLRLARVALSRPFGSARVRLYAEQPYAAVRREAPRAAAELESLLADEPDWHPMSASAAARWRKVRAWRAYRSQFQHFGYRTLVNVLRYEARYGGEMTTLE